MEPSPAAEVSTISTTQEVVKTDADPKPDAADGASQSAGGTSTEPSPAEVSTTSNAEEVVKTDAEKL